jgi:hypothetical protein
VNARAVAAISLLLVAIFTAVAVSVVNAKQPLDDAVTVSFNRVLVAKLTRLGAAGNALGCTKFRVSYYYCSGFVRPPGLLYGQRIYYTLTLAGDGCWKAARAAPFPPPVGVGPLTGCSKY